MAVDLIHPRRRAWTSATDLATESGRYVGRHRKPGTWRLLSVLRLFYVARHRAR